VSLDFCNTGISWSEILPPLRVSALPNADDLANDTSVGKDQNAPTAMPGYDGVYGFQNTAAKFAVTFSSWPTEPIVALLRISFQQAWISMLYIREPASIDETARDFP
jgi:hypothetical protein